MEGSEGGEAKNGEAVHWDLITGRGTALLHVSVCNRAPERTDAPSHGGLPLACVVRAVMLTYVCVRACGSMALRVSASWTLLHSR